MKDKHELKPCPFCGSGDVRVFSGQTVGTRDSGMRFVRCRNCGARAKWSNELEAVKSWNDRA